MSHLPRVLVGVTGGIAAYKAAELVRELRRRQCEVRVVMTSAACQFVSPLTFQALSGHRVHTDLLDADAEAGMGHIELARWADLLLIAPLSADCAARMVAGQANDLLTTLYLATSAPVLAAPAMNQQMWAHPAVQQNMAVLQQRGVGLLGPEQGEQACGDVGAGRMSEPVALADAALATLAWHGMGSGRLNGRHVLITAGPTREPIDPVRYLSNRSSGRMGFAIAAAAVAAGARVTLVAGPCNLATPVGVERIDVCSAAQMHAAVMQKAPQSDLFFAVAAVADYRASHVPDSKIKKSESQLQLPLERNPDILADVAALSARPLCVGFAAETHDLEHYARGKLERKRLDMIAANWVGGDGCAFDAADNALQVYHADGRATTLGPCDKRLLAAELLRLAAGQLNETTHGSTPES